MTWVQVESSSRLGKMQARINVANEGQQKPGSCFFGWESEDTTVAEERSSVCLVADFGHSDIATFFGSIEWYMWAHWCHMEFSCLSSFSMFSLWIIFCHPTRILVARNGYIRKTKSHFVRNTPFSFSWWRWQWGSLDIFDEFSYWNYWIRPPFSQFLFQNSKICIRWILNRAGAEMADALSSRTDDKEKWLELQKKTPGTIDNIPPPHSTWHGLTYCAAAAAQFFLGGALHRGGVGFGGIEVKEFGAIA